MTMICPCSSIFFCCPAVQFERRIRFKKIVIELLEQCPSLGDDSSQLIPAQLPKRNAAFLSSLAFAGAAPTVSRSFVLESGMHEWMPCSECQGSQIAHTLCY